MGVNRNLNVLNVGTAHLMMPKMPVGTHAEIRVVDVYVYRLDAGSPRFLLMRRSAGRAYAGSWRMVAGKIRESESAWAAGHRELTEETGLSPRRFWSVPSVNVFYEWDADRVNVIPVFAAEVDADPVLDPEHDAWAWLGLDEAVARLAWPEQARLLRLVAGLLDRGIPPECEIPIPPA